jgi:hypothetical protein
MDAGVVDRVRTAVDAAERAELVGVPVGIEEGALARAKRKMPDDLVEAIDRLRRTMEVHGRPLAVLPQVAHAEVAARRDGAPGAHCVDLHRVAGSGDADVVHRSAAIQEAVDIPWAHPRASRARELPATSPVPLMAAALLPAGPSAPRSTMVHGLPAACAKVAATQNAAIMVRFIFRSRCACNGANSCRRGLRAARRRGRRGSSVWTSSSGSWCRPTRGFATSYARSREACRRRA